MPALDSAPPTRRLPVLAAAGTSATQAVPSLLDAQGRTVSYVRLSVTDRCDLACVYCVPPAGERVHARHVELLTPHEIARLAAVLANVGAERLRFTGGEPLCRRDLVAIVLKTKAAAPALSLALTTNGTRLGSCASALARAGLASANVSVDSLHAARFSEITRGGKLGAVIDGVHAALDAGLELKTNTVVLGERSLDELPRIVEWAWSLGVVPRFIEVMPIGEAARLPSTDRVAGAAIAARLSSLVTAAVADTRVAHGPARYLSANDGSGRRVGIIAATTERFCATCNRVRVTARGDVRACLARPASWPLRELVRGDAADHEIRAALGAALADKSEGHRLGCASGPHHAVEMSLVGG